MRLAQCPNEMINIVKTTTMSCPEKKEQHFRFILFTFFTGFPFLILVLSTKLCALRKAFRSVDKSQRPCIIQVSGIILHWPVSQPLIYKSISFTWDRISYCFCSAYWNIILRVHLNIHDRRCVLNKQASITAKINQRHWIRFAYINFRIKIEETIFEPSIRSVSCPNF